MSKLRLLISDERCSYRFAKFASLNELRSYRFAQQPTVEYTTCISLRSTLLDYYLLL